LAARSQSLLDGSRLLHERIQSLCSALIAAKDEDVARTIANELRAAITEHLKEVRQQLTVPPSLPNENDS